MKAFIKQVKNAHSFAGRTRRQQQSKTPKSGGCRVGTRTGARQQGKKAIQQALNA